MQSNRIEILLQSCLGRGLSIFKNDKKYKFYLSKTSNLKHRF